MTRYLVEFRLDSPIDKNTETIRINNGLNEAYLDFEGNTGYTNEPNIKIIVPADNYMKAINISLNFIEPYINKINLVYRIRIVISPPHSHYVLEGAIGNIRRNCFVSKLNKTKPVMNGITQKLIDSVVNTNFKNANVTSLTYFRLAKLTKSSIDEFRNLRLALESLVKPTTSNRRCNNPKCGVDLICKECNTQSTFNTILDKEIEDFWVNKLHGDRSIIKEINKMRHKTFHATNFKKMNYSGISDLSREIETLLGSYLTENTGFYPISLSMGFNYYSEQIFETKFPNQEFPEDFPKEEYWRKVINAPDD